MVIVGVPHIWSIIGGVFVVRRKVLCVILDLQYFGFFLRANGEGNVSWFLATCLEIFFIFSLVSLTSEFLLTRSIFARSNLKKIAI